MWFSKVSLSNSPPRLIVRTLIAILFTLAAVLAVLFVALTLEARDHVQQAVADNLETGQRVFAALERRREQEMYTHVATLAENPTLKAALDTYQAEMEASGDLASQLLATVQRELDKIGGSVGADVIAVTDRRDITLASTGRARDLWPPGSRIVLQALEDGGNVVHLPAGVFRLLAVPLTIDGDPVGSLFRATSLDAAYALELARLSRAQIAILSDGQVVASTFPSARTAELAESLRSGTTEKGMVSLAGDDHAFQRLVTFEDGTAVYALNSMGTATAAAIGKAYRTLAYLGLLAMVLGAFASVRLARTLTRPIDQLSNSVTALATSRALDTPLPLSRTSQELDALTAAFNDLMRSLVVAEADTRAAYVGAIGALAAALDARDPYTAGHSERVSALSVSIGKELQLPHDVLEVVRLGALLHDIGKIGVSDAVLRKPGPLTADEFELIRRHPTLGARILRPVSFLAAHIPIVELHHERPDGLGYPHGLRADEIPVPARVVHVADAFDAMTSARPYRPGLSADEAIAELCRCCGTDFDAEVVGALMRALPNLRTVTAGSTAA